MLDGSRKARFAFVALVVAGQGALAVAPGGWSKGIGDLAPFRETSVARAELYRQVGPDLVLGNGIGIGVRKGQSDLVTQLNRALDAIRADGSYDKIGSKYFPFDLNQPGALAMQ